MRQLLTGTFPSTPPGPIWAFLLAAAMLLVGLSLVMIYSSSGVLADKFGSPSFFVVRQFIWVAVGATALLLTARIPYERYRAFAPWIAAAVVLGLTLVLVAGVTVNGATRWFRLGGLSIQPSELAKLGMIVYLADRLARMGAEATDWRHGLLPVVAVAGTAVILIALEPDLGTALLLSAVMVGLLFAAGLRTRHVFAAAGVAVVGATALVVSRFHYVQERIGAWLNPEADVFGRGWQAHQSLIALGAGGWQGVGLGASHQKLRFLPEGHTDFILAILGEELGLFGTAAIIGLFLVLLFQGLKIVNLAPDRFGALLALGLTLLICAQAAINIAVVTASVPTKGIGLPLVSFGGSNLVVSLAAIGILINISRHLPSGGPHGLENEHTQTRATLEEPL